MLLKQFADNPASLTMYAEWRKNPMTEAMLGFARTLSEPAGLPVANRNGEGALYYSGKIDGAYELYNMLANLPQYVEVQTAMARAQGLLKETSYTGVIGGSDE